MQGTLPFERAAVDSDRSQSLQQQRFLDRMPERARRAPLEKELSIFETFVRGERKNRTVRYSAEQLRSSDGVRGGRQARAHRRRRSQTFACTSCRVLVDVIKREELRLVLRNAAPSRHSCRE